jgi:hypothetical protein
MTKRLFCDFISGILNSGIIRLSETNFLRMDLYRPFKWRDF